MAHKRTPLSTVFETLAGVANQAAFEHPDTDDRTAGGEVAADVSLWANETQRLLRELAAHTPGTVRQENVRDAVRILSRLGQVATMLQDALALVHDDPTTQDLRRFF